MPCADTCKQGAMLVSWGPVTHETPWATNKKANSPDWIFSPSFLASTEKKASLSLQIERGLEFLHHRGIIHRDLKSANILLNACYDAKIGDLGQSVQLKHPFSSITIRLPYGDARYRAPEQFADPDLDLEFEVTESAGIWSLGCVLFELFTVEKVWEGLSYDQIVQVVAVDGLGPAVPDVPMAPLISWCFGPQPCNRPSASLLVASVQAWMQQNEAFVWNLQPWCLIGVTRLKMAHENGTLLYLSVLRQQLTNEIDKMVLGEEEKVLQTYRRDWDWMA